MRSLRLALLSLVFVGIVPFHSSAAIEHTVIVKDHAFEAGSSSDLTIDIGDSVKWVWVDSGHDVESGYGGISNGIFSSGGVQNSGHEMIVVFDEDFVDQHPVMGDVYNYYCTPHFDMGMTGSVRVLYRRKDFAASATGWQSVPANDDSTKVDCTLTVNETETQIDFACDAVSDLASGGVYNGALGEEGTLFSGCTFATLNPPSGSCAADTDRVTEIINGDVYIQLQTATAALRGQFTILGGSFDVFGRISYQNAEGIKDVPLTAGPHSIMSGDNGYFQFEDLPNGVYLIEGVLEGFEINGLPGVNPFIVNNAPVYNRLLIASEETEGPPLSPDQYAPLDFDGDGVTDPTTIVSDVSEGLLQKMRLSNSEGTSTQILGSSAVTSVSADYDGDGVSDVASVMLHGSMLHWTVASSASQTDLEFMFGVANDRLITGCDFSGDGADDLAVVSGNALRYREALTDAQEEVTLAGVAKILKASCGDVNGDGRDELLVQERRKGGAARRRARSGKRTVAEKIRAIEVESGAGILSLRVSEPKYILAPDLNRDGKAELAALVAHKQKGKLRIDGRAEGSARKIQVVLPKIKTIVVGTLKASDDSVQPGIIYQTANGNVSSMNFSENQEVNLFTAGAGETLVMDQTLRPVQ